MIRYPSRKMIITIMILIIASFLINFNSVYNQRYDSIGKDSILIVNSTMSYRLFYLKNNLSFEDLTFKKFDTISFKGLYDSLRSIYEPFSHPLIYADINEDDGMHGLEVCFEFLIDSTSIFNLWVYIPDNIYKYQELNRSNVLKKLYKISKFGIIAFKDSIEKKRLSSQNSKSIFYKEYLKGLKKLHKKKKKKKIP
ncbi:MAG TPA: hypothetical protein PLE30_10895 [Candidatus Kapabacteria bacterium]|nr:hypothetical protein [Candidatus Kapabacteria bacterium]